MSDPKASAVPLEAVPARLSVSDEPCASITREVVLGRVTVVDHTLPQGCDPFVNRCFELNETGEVLHLAAAIRVYEEVRVRRVRRIRSQVIGTILRREVAEVIEANGPSAP